VGNLRVTRKSYQYRASNPTIIKKYNYSSFSSTQSSLSKVLMGQPQWLMPAIPAVRETEIGRILFKARPSEKKVVRFPSKTNKPGMAVGVWNPSYVGSIGKRITVPGKLRQKAKPFPKSNQKSKKDGGMAQVA
jgi:hypothetical protein